MKHLTVIFIFLFCFSNSVFPQKYRYYHPDGSILCKGQYVKYKYNGEKTGRFLIVKKKFGIWTYYYKNGKTEKIESWSTEKKGAEAGQIKNGIWKNWDENGNLVKESEYDNNTLIREVDILPNNSIKETKIIYTNTGLKETRTSIDNKIIKQIVYEDGKIVKDLDLLSSNIENTKYYYYSKGNLDSIEYCDIKVIVRKELFNNGKKLNMLYTNGKISKTETIVNDEIIKITNLDNGKIINEEIIKPEFLNDALYSNSKEKLESEYIYDEQNKKLLKQNIYKNNELYSYISYEYSNDTLKKEKKFINEILVSEKNYIAKDTFEIKEYERNNLIRYALYIFNEIDLEKLYCSNGLLKSEKKIINRKNYIVKLYDNNILQKEIEYKNSKIARIALYKNDNVYNEQFFTEDWLNKTIVFNGKNYDTTKYYIPNGSFEEYNHFPNNEGQASECALGWFNPNDATPDYLHISGSKGMDLPNNRFGFTYPNSGSACVGIYSDKDWKEFLQAKLLNKLEKWEIYYIEFYLCKGLRFTKDDINEIGIYFSKNQTKSSQTTSLKVKPNILFNKYEFIENSNYWVKVSSYYTAIGDEEFVTIGYFNENDSITYYYIDDINMYKVDSKDDNKTKTISHKWLSFNSISSSKNINSFEHYILDNIYFEVDDYNLNDVSRKELNKLKVFLEKNSDVKIEISGHTDNTGDYEKNINLSLLRAKSVASFLIDNGIAPERLQTKGYGGLMPIDSNKTKAGREKNRRVEVTILKN